MVLLIPGAIAPASAPVISSLNLVSASVPVGPVRTLLDTLTGDYTPADIATIRAAYNLLERTGTLAKLDSISFGLNTATDSLRNWTGGTDGTRSGGTFSAGGFQMDGVDDYIDPAFDISGAGKYTLDDCSFGVMLKRGNLLGTTFYGVGRLAAGDPSSRIAPRSTTNTVGVSVNSSTLVTAAYTGPVEGYWHAQRNSSTTTYLWRNSSQLIGSTSAASVSLPTSGNRPVIGRTAGSYYDTFVTGWFSGDAMDPTQRAALQSAFEFMTAHFARNS